jgi:hypothetical protein
MKPGKTENDIWIWRPSNFFQFYRRKDCFILSIHQVQRSWRGLIRNRGPDSPASNHSFQPKAPHQALDGAFGNLKALTLHLVPYLPGSIHLVVLVPDALDFGFKRFIPAHTRWRSFWIFSTLGELVVGRWGDR